MEEKDILGRQLIELGDLTRDLTDEVVSIDAMSVNAFSWLQWEVSTHGRRTNREGID